MMKPLGGHLVAGWVVLLLVTAPGLLPSRADALPWGPEEAFRGDEWSDRGYTYDEDYFTRLLTFGVDKEWLDRWDRAGVGLLASVGSLTSRDFYFLEEVKLSAEVVPGSRIVFSHTRDEDFDSRFHSTFAEWMQDVPGTPLSLSLIGQISSDKEEDDVGFAATWRDPGGAWARLSWILSDFTWNQKAPRGERYSELPRTLRLRCGFEPLPRLEIRLDGGRTFPTALASSENGLVLDYERTFGRGLATLRLRERDQLWLAVEGEVAQKGRRGLAGAEGGEGTTDRKAWQARLEYIRHLRRGGRGIAGLRWFRLDEAADHPGDPAAPPSYDFTEYTLYGGWRTPPWRALSLEARLYLTAVDDRRAFAGDPQRSGEWDDPQAALTLALLWEPREGAALLLNPTFHLDEKRFGGGNLQLMVTW